MNHRMPQKIIDNELRIANCETNAVDFAIRNSHNTHL